MTIRDLIKRLEKEDQDRLVVCVSDSEGNNYSPLYDMWSGVFFEDENGCTTVGDLSDFTEEEREEIPLIDSVFLVPKN